MATEVYTPAYETSAVGKTNLPQVSSYSETIFFAGNAHTMADANIKFQYVDVTRRRRFTLGWSYISASEYATIETAINAIPGDDDGVFTFYPPDSASGISVTFDPSAMEWTWNAITVPNGTAGEKKFLWSGTWVLLEA
jgi:hypothetical protein